jgi:LysR family transcriptional regulator for metE and metH
MFLMIAHGRGVGALPRWMVEEYGAKFGVSPVRLGEKGVAKQIFLGYREADADIDYLRAFIEMALTHRGSAEPVL